MKYKLEGIIMQKYWIWLTQLSGIGPIKQKRLLYKFNNPKKIFSANINELKKCKGIGQKLANRIKNSNSLNKAKIIFEKCKKNNIKLLNYNNYLYPERVKKIKDTPVLLYYMGNLFPQKYTIAIIGARRCSNYGKKVTKRVASFLANKNIAVISGMAKGIDSYAHSVCINYGGYTLAVLGTGLDICYPAEHRELKKKIIAKGAILTEYPPGTQAIAHNFPKRNRLLSAWSHKVLIVEAGMKSGCLITDSYAKKQNRKLLVVPGGIFNQQSCGCNELIYKGEEIFLKKEQLLSDKIKLNKEKPNSNKMTKKKKKLESEEEKILDMLKEEGEISPGKLAYKINIDQMKLVEKLSIMEIKGLLKLQGSKCKLC